MDYEHFLNEIIRLGIEGASKSYSKPEDKHRLEGSIEGFEACRRQIPSDILTLLIEVRKDTQIRYWESCDRDTKETLDLYWKATCKAAEIEWVANVISAGIPDMPPIVPVTARGMMMAAKILGIAPGPMSSTELGRASLIH